MGGIGHGSTGVDDKTATYISAHVNMLRLHPRSDACYDVRRFDAHAVLQVSGKLLAAKLQRWQATYGTDDDKHLRSTLHLLTAGIVYQTDNFGLNIVDK
jgi:hypothetical protein